MRSRAGSAVQEVTELMVGLDLDPVVIVVLGSQAATEFTPVEDEL